MKPKFVALAACLALLSIVASGQANEKKHKPGKLTGTWECMSHGGSQGDLPFTLMLEQSGEQVSGTIESPIGGTEITSATFKKKHLEIQIDTPQGTYLLTARLKKGRLSGEWTHDPEKGTWEGSKQPSAPSQ
jgi:hypothetical protein